MRKIFTFLVVFSLVHASVRVAVSIKPLALVVEEIIGEKVLTILPPNRSPHFFSPEPGKIKEAIRARVLFKIGAGLEFWEIEGVRVIDLSMYTKLIEKDGKPNPHYWLSPVRMEPVIEKIGEILEESFPEKKEDIGLRTANLIARIQRLDERIRLESATINKKRILLYHPAWEYFFRDYGFNIAGVITRNPGQPPKPRNLKVVEADLLVLEPSVPLRFAKIMCEGKKMKYVYLDPLASENFKTYDGFIMWNFSRIKKALK